MTVDVEPAPFGRRLICRTWCWEFLLFYKFPLSNVKWIHCPSSGNRRAQRLKLCLTANSVAFYSSKLQYSLESQPQIVQMIWQQSRDNAKRSALFFLLVDNTEDLGQGFSSDILRLLYSPFFVSQHCLLCHITGSFWIWAHLSTDRKVWNTDLSETQAETQPATTDWLLMGKQPQIFLTSCFQWLCDLTLPIFF